MCSNCVKVIQLLWKLTYYENFTKREGKIISEDWKLRAISRRMWICLCPYSFNFCTTPFIRNNTCLLLANTWSFCIDNLIKHVITTSSSLKPLSPKSPTVFMNCAPHVPARLHCHHAEVIFIPQTWQTVTTLHTLSQMPLFLPPPWEELVLICYN